MKTIGTALVAALTTLLTASAADLKLVDCPPPPPGFPRFQFQEIASDFKIGYAVHVADVNGDKKPDIVVVDKDRVVWYENPSWKLRTILKGKTKPDNVCICSLDIDGDKQIDFVLGAGWRGTDTKTPGTLQWLRRGKTLDDEWEMFPIPCEEPSIHRVQNVETSRNDQPKQIVIAPLLGRDSTKEKNWMDGHPVKILEYVVPTNPTNAESWKPKVISQQLHGVHGMDIAGMTGVILTPSYFASFDGIHGMFNGETYLVHEGDQTNLTGNRGASEVANWGNEYLATIEPWHGHQIVFYRQTNKTRTNGAAIWSRNVIDNKLRWGHAVKLEFLIREEFVERKLPFIIAGVRDNPDPKQGDKFTEKRGVRLYRATDTKGEKWERYILEDGGVACEDLAVADLDSDGKPEIIAVGRQTQNCRIYWNKGK